MSEIKTKTVAQLKLALILAETPAAAVGRKVGSTGTTVRLLAVGAASPKATTVTRFTVLGIEPADWFTPVTNNADESAASNG
jgi:hypothetical protein